jgi:hypothetical protein
MKTTAPRPAVNEPPVEKKATKTATATTTKATTQKQSNPKPIVNAPVKPMPIKRTLSQMDDRLSDEECKLFSFFKINIFSFFYLKRHQIHRQMFQPLRQTRHRYKRIQ